jgi:glutamate dehydrogenase/leucine dehydrogenase
MKADDGALRKSGILYCPDYLANAGGIIAAVADQIAEERFRPGEPGTR